MEIIDDYQTNFTIIQAIYFTIHLIIVVACIKIAFKSKSNGAILMVVSATLTVILSLAQIFLSHGLKIFDNASINSQTLLTYINILNYGLFGTGLMLFALYNRKDHAND